MAKARTKQQLTVENDELRARLQELEDTLEAIRSGSVDAIVTSGPAVTIEGADHAYHTMVESMNEGAVMLMTDGTILYGNHQFRQMTGTSPSEIVGRRFHDFVSVPDHPILDAILVKEGLDRPKAEIRLGKGPDADLPAQIAASPVELGGAKALALVITDLSAQRRYEEIVAAEKLSRRILEQAQEAIAVCINGCVVRANRAFYEICGSFPLMQPFDLVFPLRISESEMFSAAMPESGQIIRNQEVRYYRPDGKIFNLALSAGPLVGRENRILGSLVSLVDITERKRAEEALLESEKRLRLLGDNLPDSAVYQYVHELDGSDRFLYFSAGIERLNGVSVEDVLRDAGALHRQIPPEYKTRLVEVEARSKRELSDFDMEVPMRRPDGALRWMRLQSRPRRMPDGRTIWDGVQSDITERMAAEKELQKSEARLRLLSETASRLLAAEDPQGLINDLCRDVMEFLDCQAFFNFMVDERAGRLRLNACAGIPAGEIRKLEWLDYGAAVCGCVARDGARIIAEDIFHTPDVRTELVKSYGIQAYCCHPLRARDRLIGTLSFGTKTRASFNAEEVEMMRIVADQVAIAMQRIQSQQEIVESSQRLQLALEAGGMGMWAWDLQTNRMIWNSREYELMGLPAGDGVTDAEEFFRYMHPEDAPALRDALGEVIASGSLFMREFRVVRNGGQLHWLTAVGRVIRAESGQPLSIIGINYDITERKKILDVLRESEERFRGVFEQSSSGIMLSDFEGRILEVNPSFSRVLGYSGQELVGRNIVDLTHPEDRKIEQAKAMELKEGRLEAFRLEKRFLGRDGRIIWAEIGMSGLHDDQGKIVYTLGMMEDITERKAADEALRRSKEELEEKVGERTAELMLLLEDLEKGRNDLRKLASELVMAEERERKRIAVTLHDEVAQTLAAAKMRLDLLRKITDGQASCEVVDEARDLLVQSIRETRALMTDISSPILYEMGLPSAVQNLAEQTSASYGLAVSQSVTGDFGSLKQELSVMIYQAVRELLKNVSKHSQARNASVRVSVDESGIRAIVADDGRGFDLDDISSPGEEGGFGLFSIRERVKSFNGSMQIESAPGKGTVVTVVLPSSLGKTEEIRDEEKASPRSRRRRKT